LTTCLCFSPEDPREVEYPTFLPPVLMSLNLPGVFPRNRPVPGVIAHGYTTHEVRRRFGLVGVYDGSGAGVGRVVVDSTWHHWLSFNLYGFRHTRPRVYGLMQAFFRNVALWLARRQQRAEMLYAATWGVLVGSSPMAFRGGDSLWRMGELALDAIGRTASQCTVFDLGTVEVHPEVVEAFFARDNADRSEPSSSNLSQELFNRAIVGGIASALLEPALRFRDALGRGGRPRMDGGEVGRLAAAGAEAGYRAFVDATTGTLAEVAELREGLSRGFHAFPALPTPEPFARTTLRIVTERLQLTDPTDPLLIDGYVTLVVQVRAAESIIVEATVED
jgi:hypothetical protein